MGGGGGGGGGEDCCTQSLTNYMYVCRTYIVDNVGQFQGSLVQLPNSDEILDILLRVLRTQL